MFSGSIVALITPMDERGKIDKKSLKNLINYHIISGTKAIVSAGTTGENSTLTHEEHNNIIMWTLEISDERIPIIAGTGANSTMEAIALTNKISNSGVIGCLSVTPYYNRPNQKGLYQHFSTIAKNSNLPQIMYNVPNRTGCDLLPETIAQLAKIKNIIGIKEATGNLSRVSQIQNLIKKKFFVLSGDDFTALDFIKLGGHGIISVTANIAAKEIAQLCSLAINKNFEKAKILNKKLTPLHKALFCESNPIPIKSACKILGLIEHDTLRLPLTNLDKNKIKMIKKILTKMHLIKKYNL